MPFGKKYRKAVEGLDLSQRFSVEEAVEKSLGASFAKFDETVDVAIGLGVDPKYSDQMVRGAVSLPHGLGKTVRVAVFAEGAAAQAAEEAGADIVGTDELMQQIQAGEFNFDAAVATLERQIRKNKTRLEKRLRQGAFERSVDEEISTFVPDGPEEGEYNLVRSKRFPIKPMTRDEAILQMNLLGHSFFAFRDEDADGAFAVVYCRNDGDYGLIEDEA